MNKTSIAWVVGPDGASGFTWNPVVGCKAIAPGCQHCWAAKLAATRLAHRPEYKGLAYIDDSGESALPYRWTGEQRFLPERLAEPLRKRKPAGIFVCDMSDLFGEGVTNEQIAAVFGVMAATPQHRYYVLTKRARRMREWFKWALSFGSIHACVRANWKVISEFFHNDECSRFGVNKYGEKIRTVEDAGHTVLNACGVQHAGPLSNVFLGVSISDQTTADANIPELLATPAAVRFVSYEPALSGVEFRREWIGSFCGCGMQTDACDDWKSGKGCALAPPRISWIVVGGESGPRPRARPCHLEWMRSSVRQCAEAGCSCFVKQLGANAVEDMLSPLGESQMVESCEFRDRAGADSAEWPADLRVRQFPTRSQATKEAK